MVLMSMIFPHGFTDEEMILKGKYAKLKKKKKALHDFLNPKNEPEKQNQFKRPLEPKDAKEYARKLVVSGKITVAPRPGTAKTTFKRPRGLERKLNEARSSSAGSETPGGLVHGGGGGGARMAHEPFQSTTMPPGPPPPSMMGSSPGSGGGGSQGARGSSVTAGISTSLNYQPFIESSSPSGGTSGSASGGAAGYGQFGFNKGMSKFGSIPRNRKFAAVKPMTKVEQSDSNVSFNPNRSIKTESAEANFGMLGSIRKPSDKPKQGQTVHVRGKGITEAVVREVFSSIGTIFNISMELERSCGFVTFDKIESAERAISEKNGIFTRGGIQLQVSLARRQPAVSELINDSSASASWTALASSQSQKGTHRDSRAPQIYDDTMEF